MSRSTAGRTLGALLLAGALAAMPHERARAADDPRVAELERRADESARVIAELTQRIRELEARLPPVAPAAAAGPGPDSSERLAAVEQEVRQIVEASASPADSGGLPIHGFADVAVGTNHPTDADLEGFSVGTLDFYLTPSLGERTRALLELNFEVDESGELATDLERAQIGFEVGEGSTAWIGRFHTPYGYYNNAFHHGQQISTALRRPRFLSFEDQGGILPAHTVGAWWTARSTLDAGQLNYDLFVGNAQRIADGTLDLAAAGVDAGDAIVGGNLSFSPGNGPDGLRFGASFFTAEVADDTASLNRTRVRNYGLYAVYATDRWENMAEIYLFDDEDLSGATGSHRSYAGFVQAAYRANRLTPYARYEHADLDQEDAYFAAQASGVSYVRYALGVRFDLDLTTAIKLELAHTEDQERSQDQYDEALMQYAIRF